MNVHNFQSILDKYIHMNIVIQAPPNKSPCPHPTLSQFPLPWPSGTMHADHANQKSMEESKFLWRLSPILIICALRLGKHSLQLFYDFFQVGHLSAGNKTNTKNTLRYSWLLFVYLLGPWKQLWPIGFLAFFLSIFFSLYSCTNKKARRVNDSGQMDWGMNKIK